MDNIKSLLEDALQKAQDAVATLPQEAEDSKVVLGDLESIIDSLEKALKIL